MAAIHAHRRSCLGSGNILPFAWWKSDVGVTVSGGFVTIWTDAIRNTQALAATSAFRPTFTASADNGNPAIVFSGMQRLDANISFPAGVKTLFIVLVVKTNTGAAMQLLQQSTNPYFSNGAYAITQKTTGVGGIFQPTNSSGNYADIGTNVLATSGLTMAISIDTQLATNALKVYANASVPVASGAKAGGGGDLPGNTFLIGNNANANAGLVGLLYEVIVFTAIPSNGQFRAIQAANAAKYAFPY